MKVEEIESTGRKMWPKNLNKPLPPVSFLEMGSGFFVTLQDF